MKAYWNSLPTWARGVVVVVLLAALYFVAWKPLKRELEKAKAKARLNNFGPDGDGFNAGTPAAELYDAIYNNDPLGWTEDETRIVNTLKNLSPQHVAAVAAAYLGLYDKVLQEDVIAALDAAEWNQVKHLF